METHVRPTLCGLRVPPREDPHPTVRANATGAIRRLRTHFYTLPEQYLRLLAAVHAMTRARQAVLSVSVDQIEPLAGLRIPEQWASGRPHWWSTGFLRDIAGNADEVAVMAYDSGMPTSASYSGYVNVESRLAAEAVPPNVKLLISVPAYHTHEPGHTSAETVSAAVRGIRLSIGNGRTSQRPGVALYADFSADPTDWSAYFNDWVRPAP